MRVIVPRGVELIVEAQILNKDIGFVRAGQEAEIKVEAFPFTRPSAFRKSAFAVLRPNALS